MTTALPIDDVAGDVWLSSLSGYQKTLVAELLASGLSEESVAELWLSRASAEHTAAFGGASVGANFLSSIKTELRKVICGDPEYEDIRKEALSIWSGQKYAVVAIIAGAVALHLGLAVVAVTPVVALLLSAVRKIGLNAWCNPSS